MLEVKCIGKKRDKAGHIIAYRLVDKQGEAKILEAKELKKLIRAKKLNVVNLTLTSDNRLVNGGQEQEQQVKAPKQIDRGKSTTVATKDFPSAKKFTELTEEQQNGVVTEVCAGKGELGVFLTQKFKECVMNMYNADVKQLATDLKNKHNIAVCTDSLNWIVNERGEVTDNWDLSNVFTICYGADYCGEKLDVDIMVSGRAEDVSAEVTVMFPDFDDPLECKAGVGFPCDFTTAFNAECGGAENPLYVVYNSNVVYIGGNSNSKLMYVLAKLFEDTALCSDVKGQFNISGADALSIAKGFATKVLANLDKAGLKVGSLEIYTESSLYSNDNIEFNYRGKTRYMGDVNALGFAQVVKNMLFKDAFFRREVEEWYHATNDNDIEVSDDETESIEMLASSFCNRVAYEWKDCKCGEALKLQGNKFFDTSLEIKGFEKQVASMNYTVDLVPTAVEDEIDIKVEAVQNFLYRVLEHMKSASTSRMGADWVRGVLSSIDTMFLCKGTTIKWVKD